VRAGVGRSWVRAGAPTPPANTFAAAGLEPGDRGAIRTAGCVLLLRHFIPLCLFVFFSSPSTPRKTSQHHLLVQKHEGPHLQVGSGDGRGDVPAHQLHPQVQAQVGPPPLIPIIPEKTPVWDLRACGPVGSGEPMPPGWPLLGDVMSFLGSQPGAGEQEGEEKPRGPS